MEKYPLLCNSDNALDDESLQGVCELVDVDYETLLSSDERKWYCGGYLLFMRIWLQEKVVETKDYLCENRSNF